MARTTGRRSARGLLALLGVTLAGVLATGLSPALAGSTAGSPSRAAQAPATPSPEGRQAARAATRASAALARLRADSRGGVRVEAGGDGLGRVIGVRRGHDPLVTPASTPRAAARAHLARYGAAIGVSDPGTRLVATSVRHAVTGDVVVRFRELRDGVPVVGGGVAVALRPDRQLVSLTASVSSATMPRPTVSAAAAEQAARAVVAKTLGQAASAAVVGPPVLRLYDPAVLGVRRTSDPATHAHGVWWVEAHAGPAYHRLVLLDDRTGALVADVDLVEPLDRVVCDNHDTLTTDIPCTHGFARTETSRPSRVRDVNDAFDLAGVVSRFYRRIGGLDLTRLLGVPIGGHRSLSSTVNYCDFTLPQAYCPYRNAFWDGQAMFYGTGFASADDVVGHELTHGVIQHNADLFYWGQSGAINESLADVMGEIIDHRHPSPGDSVHSWTIGEDLPGGAVRDLRHPGRFGQPATMTSRRFAPAGYADNGGVHTNSGVGNRTFYLISQGGRQGGVSVRGIDGPSLTRSATLYLAVIEHLVPGSDYADLAAVLDTSCRQLAVHHRAGMTRADCREVHRATVATGLRTTPPRAPQPPDAAMSCPRGAGPVRVLFDSETGTPRAKFSAGSTWVRAPRRSAFPPVAANATSGRASWFSSEPPDTTVSSLTMRPVALPANRPAYLWFQQWRRLEAGTNVDGSQVNYDAGTVEVADPTRALGPQPAEGLPWVNGPHDVVTGLYGNPAAGRVGFSRDSRGYVASRLRLSGFAGDAVSPQFTMNTDNDSYEVGWYLDDVRVYTCTRGPVPRSVPGIEGTPTVGSLLTASPGRWTPVAASTAYHWYADGVAIPGASGPSYVVADADVGARLTVRVSATTAQGRHGSTFSAATAAVTPAG